MHLLQLCSLVYHRVASIVKKAKTELEEIRLRQRAVTEKLIASYKSVLEQLTPDGATTATEHGVLQAGPSDVWASAPGGTESS